MVYKRKGKVRKQQKVPAKKAHLYQEKDSQTVEPVILVEPEKPVAPVIYVEQLDKQGAPVLPEEPGETVAPVLFEVPDEPVLPEEPDEIALPEEPGERVAPVLPEVPDEPVSTVEQIGTVIKCGPGVKVGSVVKFGPGVKVGSIVKCGPGVNAGSIVNCDPGVKVGSVVRYGSGIKVGSVVKVCPVVKVGSRVKCGPFVKIGSVIKIGPFEKWKAVKPAEAIVKLDQTKEIEPGISIEPAKNVKQPVKVETLIKVEPDTPDELVVEAGSVVKVVHISEEHSPLMNDVVLTELFKYLPLNDLLTCRRVCRKWRMLASSEVKENSMVKFEISDDYCHEVKIQKFVDVFGCSYRNEIPCNFSFTNIDMNCMAVENLFALCGPFIKYLHLKLDSSNINANIFQDLLLNKIPILETLEIEELPDDAIKNTKLDNTTTTPICLSTLIIHDSKTYGYRFFYEVFKISDYIESIRVLQQESTSVLTALRDTGLLSEMKSIRYKKPNDGDFDTLVKLSLDGYAFSKLYFVSLPDYFCSRTLETFLKLQKDSLEYMSIGGATYHLSIDCPTMKNLAILKLNSYSRVLAPMTVQTQFSTLQHLEICCSALESNWECFFPRAKNKGQFRELKTLSLCGLVNNSTTIKTLGRLFPTIAKLYMKVYKPSNGVIELIWKYWANLEQLVIHLHGTNKNIDALLTGISASDCSKIADRLIYDCKPNTVSVSREKDALVNLKKLKKLFLYVTKPKQSDPCYLITDITGYYAFGMMPNLRELIVTWSQISEDCVQYLTEKLSQCKISNHKLRLYRMTEEIGKPYFEVCK